MVPLEAPNSAPTIDQLDLGRSPEGIGITGGCDFDFHRATLSGSFALLGNHRAPPPFCTPPRPHALEPKLARCSGCLTERVRPRRSSRPRRFPPRPILSDRSARRRSVAPCSRPWGSPGFGLRRRLRASHRRRFRPRWRTPFEAFPSPVGARSSPPSLLARDGRSPIGRNPPRSPFRPRDVSVRGQSMLPWDCWNAIRCRTSRRVPVGSHRADHIPFTSKSASVDVPLR